MSLYDIVFDYVSDNYFDHIDKIRTLPPHIRHSLNKKQYEKDIELEADVLYDVGYLDPHLWDAVDGRQRDVRDKSLYNIHDEFIRGIFPLYMIKGLKMYISCLQVAHYRRDSCVKVVEINTRRLDCLVDYTIHKKSKKKISRTVDALLDTSMYLDIVKEDYVDDFYVLVDECDCSGSLYI